MLILAFFMALLGASVCFVKWAEHSGKMALAKHVEAQKSFLGALKKEGLSPIRSPIDLGRDESCFYSGSARLLKLRHTRAGVSYQGLTTRVKLGRNTYYRLGHFSGGAKTREEWREVDQGMVVVTDKRIVFLGRKQTDCVRIKDALNLNSLPDGYLRIDKPRGQPFVLTKCQSLIISALYTRLKRSSALRPPDGGDGQTTHRLASEKRVRHLPGRRRSPSRNSVRTKNP
jgi:hypothetical protein